MNRISDFFVLVGVISLLCCLSLIALFFLCDFFLADASFTADLLVAIHISLVYATVSFSVGLCCYITE